MGKRSNESLGDQSRDFHDTDGTAWRVRIEQGGGVPGVRDAPPIAVLIFHSTTTHRSHEISIAGDAGAWDLSAYTEKRLGALLREAQAHATEPGTE